MKMKKFTVRRKNWARGDHPGTKLLSGDGYMCCLGFAACQVSRIPKKRLLYCGEPNEVYRASSFLTESYGYDVMNNDLAAQAMAINDDTRMDDATRELRLKSLFRDHKIIVKFVD